MTKFKILFVVFFALLSLQGVGAWAQMTKRPAKAPKLTTVPASSFALPAASSTSPVTPITPALPANVLREVDYIVALVNSEPLTRNEVLIRQAGLEAQWAAQGVSQPPKDVVFKRVLDQLIDERAMTQAGGEMGVRVNESQLNDALLNIARQNDIASVSALKTKYEAEGGSWTTYREEIRGELIRIQAREREVDARVRVSEAEIDQALQAQNLASTAAPDINVAQILIALPDNPSPETVAQGKQKALDVVAQLRAGADFAKLAAQASDATDKTKGGLMGLRAADRYPALFVDAVQGLKVGAISEPIRSDAGFHILKLVQRVASTTAMATESRVRHILLPITADRTDAKAKALLASYKSQIEQGRASFEALAKEHSADGSAAQGGDLGWAGPGLFVPEFERVMNALPLGKISEPFTSRFGVHLLEVVDRRQVAVSIRDQRALVQAQLREKKAAETAAIWIAETRARAFVEYKNIAQ
jgi:peptidyl-prolyl cis-trans isomerase SurA